MLSKDAKWGWIATWGEQTLPARVICWDAKGPYPVRALIDHGEHEMSYAFTADGRHDFYTLRDAPAPKASGVDWIVRWRSDDGYRRHASLHYTKEAATAHARFLISKGRSHVSVIEVPWTEGMGVEAEGGE